MEMNLFGFLYRIQNGKKLLYKTNYFYDPEISCFYCYDENFQDFLESVLSKGGFYISRYEIGIKNNKIVSSKNAEMISGLNIEEAKKGTKQIYDKKSNVVCEVINGFAYDTTLNWIYSNNTNVDLIDTKDILKTGKQAYNNIYDLFDNNYELTQEKYRTKNIIRGCSNIEIKKKNLVQSRSREDIRHIIDNKNNIGTRYIIYEK